MKHIIKYEEFKGLCYSGMFISRPMETYFLLIAVVTCDSLSLVFYQAEQEDKLNLDLKLSLHIGSSCTEICLAC